MYRNFRRASIIAIALAVLVFGIALAAIIQSVTLQDEYVVSYLGYEEITSNITKWTYAVTEPEICEEGGCGLSHWTVGVCSSIKLKNPQFEIVSSYETTTITNIADCGPSGLNCVEANYIVSIGKDPSLDQEISWGVKFTPDGGIGLEGSPDRKSHVLQFFLYHPDGFQESPVDVAVKTGNGGLVGAITGPQCLPTAVNLASFGASTGRSPMQNGIFWMFAAGLLLLVGGGSYLYARRRA